MKHSSILITFAACLLAGCVGIPNQTPAPSKTPAATEPPAPTDAPAPTEVPESPWEIVIETELEQSAKMIAFLDETSGIAVARRTEGPPVRYTTDGGQTWTESDITGCRFGVDIVDAQVAWTCGGRIPSSLSRDGGQTWESRERPLEPFCRVQCRYPSFLDDTTGWAASRVALAATSDGGETWTDIVLPDDIGSIQAIVLRTAGAGYVLDETGTLYTTQDGGLTWSSQTLDTGQIGAAAMRFFDPDRGVVVIEAESGLLALRTADGGQTWLRENVPGEKAGRMYLTRDGQFLTISQGKQAMVLRYTGTE